MRVAREYTTYLARVLAARLPAEHLISFRDAAALTALIHHALEEEVAVEDRINDEARAILASHAAEMQQLGASYGDAFKKIKSELVRQHKAVL
ncbi:MAG: DUF507 family protein [Terriglobales bacterium]